MDNLALICKQCSDDRKMLVQAAIKDWPMTNFVGHYVKMAFTQDDQVEHMWVEIDQVTDGALSGTLNNTPVLVTNVQFGDQVRVNLADIEEVLL